MSGCQVQEPWFLLIDVVRAHVGGVFCVKRVCALPSIIHKFQLLERGSVLAWSFRFLGFFVLVVVLAFFFFVVPVVPFFLPLFVCFRFS